MIDLTDTCTTLISTFGVGVASDITHICARPKKIESHADDEDVDNKSDIASNATLLPEPRSKIGPAHPQIGSPPENPAEEGVEECTHQGQQV